MNKQLLREKVRFGIARECDFTALGADEVKAIKSDNGIAQYRFVERALKPLEERQFEHDGSTEHQDGMGDVIRVPGWDLTRMKIGKIPLFLNHSPYPAPMGILLSAKKGWTGDTPQVRSLIIRSEVYGPELYGDMEFGKTIEFHFTLMANGLLRGGSVGFIPKAWRYPTDEEERTALNLGKFGMLFEEQELLEFSITSIPANPHANERKSLDSVKALVTEGKLTQAAADYWLKVASTTPDEWLERNVPHIGRKSVAMPELPAWVKGAAAEGVQLPAKSKDAEPHGACTSCADAKSALADTVRSVVREELQVLRLAIADKPTASVPTSTQSTSERGRVEHEAQVADSSRKPVTSRRESPVPFHREALLRDVERRLRARASKNGSDRNRTTARRGEEERG